MSSGSPTKIPMNYRFYPFKSSFESYVRFGWVLNGDVDFNKVLPAFLIHTSWEPMKIFLAGFALNIDQIPIGPLYASCFRTKQLCPVKTYWSILMVSLQIDTVLPLVIISEITSWLGWQYWLPNPNDTNQWLGFTTLLMMFEFQFPFDPWCGISKWVIWSR